ncbi:MAG: hypothetical protein LBQ22_08595, partial [Bacteroidales bacterium]|nr:hypothetical protein [Bacteroidales bacterium]
MNILKKYIFLFVFFIISFFSQEVFAKEKYEYSDSDKITNSEISENTVDTNNEEEAEAFNIKDSLKSFIFESGIVLLANNWKFIIMIIISCV